jgi:hypothetical protein
MDRAVVVQGFDDATAKNSGSYVCSYRKLCGTKNSASVRLVWMDTTTSGWHRECDAEFRSSDASTTLGGPDARTLARVRTLYSRLRVFDFFSSCFCRQVFMHVGGVLVRSGGLGDVIAMVRSRLPFGKPRGPCSPMIMNEPLVFLPCLLPFFLGLPCNRLSFFTGATRRTHEKNTPGLFPAKATHHHQQ